MSIGLFKFFLIFAAPALGGENQKLVLRAEQKIDRFVHRQTLVFDKEQLVLSRNSNFMCRPTVETQIGVFIAKYTDDRKSNRDDLLELQTNLEKPDSNPAVKPIKDRGELRLYLGAREIESGTPAAQALKRILTNLCDELDWTARRAVSVGVRNSGGTLALEVLELRKQGEAMTSREIRGALILDEVCRSKDGQVLACDIEGYGQVFLHPRDEQELEEE